MLAIAKARCMEYLPLIINIIKNSLRSQSACSSVFLRWDTGIVWDACLPVASLIENNKGCVLNSNISICNNNTPSHYGQASKFVSICIDAMARTTWADARMEDLNHIECIIKNGQQK